MTPWIMVKPGASVWWLVPWGGGGGGCGQYTSICTPGHPQFFFRLLVDNCHRVSPGSLYLHVEWCRQQEISSIYVHLFRDTLEQMSIWGRSTIDLEPWHSKAWGLGRYNLFIYGDTSASSARKMLSHTNKTLLAVFIANIFSPVSADRVLRAFPYSSNYKFWHNTVSFSQRISLTCMRQDELKTQEFHLNF